MTQLQKPRREVVVFYATDPLERQMTGWARQHPQHVVKYAFTRLLPEVRAVLEHADTVLIDATDDCDLAADVFSQAAAQLGPQATAVYTEKMHDGLELFIRSRGAAMFLGPQGEQQWEAFFQSAWRQPRRRTWRKAA